MKRTIGVTFDRSLSGKDHITRVVTRARKGLTALKTMACNRMPQRILAMLYQTLVLSVIDYGLGLLTLSTSQLKRLETIQNEGMRTVLGCTQDTSCEAMRSLLDLPDMVERHKIAQVKAYLRVRSDDQNPLHDKVGRMVHTRLLRGTEWMNEAALTLAKCCDVENIRKGSEWVSVTDTLEQYTRVVATLGRACREWPEGAANAEVETLIEENSEHGDVVIFTDGSVQRGVKSGWAFSARINGVIRREQSGATSITTSSMCMEMKAITEALNWTKATEHRTAILVTDSMSTLAKVKRHMLYADW